MREINRRLATLEQAAERTDPDRIITLADWYGKGDVLPRRGGIGIHTIDWYDESGRADA